MELAKQENTKFSWLDAALITALLLLITALHALYLNPPNLSDQLEYFSLAARFPPYGQYPDIANLRLGLIVPLALLIKVFGYSELSYYLIPFLSLFGFVAGIYLIACQFYSRTIAFLSAFLAIFIPNLIVLNGDLLPDMPAMVLLLFAFLGILRAGLNPRSRGLNSPLHFLLVGAQLGWAYLTKESSVILFPMVLVMFVLLRMRARHLLYIGLGFFIMFSLEMLNGYLLYENPFVRFMYVHPRGTDGGVSYKISKILTYLLILLNKFNATGYQLLIFFSLLGSAALALKGDKKSQLMLLWFLNVYGALTLIGLLPVIRGWENYTILRLRLFRYWIMLIPAWMIGGVAALKVSIDFLIRNHKVKSEASRWIANITLLLLVLINTIASLSSAADSPEFLRNGNDHLQEFRHYLVENGFNWDVIWVEQGGRRALERVIPIYTYNTLGVPIWNGTIQYMNDEEGYKPADNLDDGLLIVDHLYMTRDDEKLPDYLFNPPKNWCLVFSSENGRLSAYDINCNDHN